MKDVRWAPCRVGAAHHKFAVFQPSPQLLCLLVMEADVPAQGQAVARLVFPGDDPDLAEVEGVEQFLPQGFHHLAPLLPFLDGGVGHQVSHPGTVGFEHPLVPIHGGREQ